MENELLGATLTDEAIKTFHPAFSDEGLDSYALQKLVDDKSSSTSDSENSYKTLFTKDEFFELIIFINFNHHWMFLTACANIYLYFSYTYQTVFNEDFDKYIVIMIFNWICNIITIIDVITLIVHANWKRIAIRRALKPHHKALMTLDVLSLISVINDIIHTVFNNKTLNIIAIACVVFRLYRVYRYFYTVSITAGSNNTQTLVQKYGIIFIILTHTFSCIWKMLECYNCYDDPNGEWSQSITSTTYIRDFTPFNWYTICIYYVIGSLTAIGFGDIHANSVWERLVTVVAMILGFLFMTVFLGAWTSVQLESYRRHANFSKRLLVIAEYMDHPKLSEKLKKKITNYYLIFWVQQGGMKTSTLFQTLPLSIKQQINLDRYWYLFCQSYVLRDLHDGFKRSLASVMTTEIYTQGEAIFEQGKQKEMMIFIVKGSVHILSAEDTESPVLTLGMGSLIGESNLIYGNLSPVHVTASSYCILQCLKKTDFWKVACNFKKLKQSKLVHSRLAAKMKVVYKDTKNPSTDSQSFEKPLKLVKAKLRTEQPKKGEIYINAESSMMSRTFLTDSNFSDLYILSKQETTLKHSDEICLHSTWPWVLQPQSVLITVWEFIIVVTVIIVAILYPYQFSFNRTFPNYMRLVKVSVDIIYFSDVVLQIFTAVEDDNIITSSIKDILSIRCKQISFLIDVVAIIPLDLFVSAVNISKNDRYLSVLVVNRLLKVHRLIKFLKNMGKGFKINVAMIRCIKYFLYLLFLAYFMGALYYMQACFYEECLKTSWMHRIEEEDYETNSNRHVHVFALSFYFAILVICITGFGDVTAFNPTEMHIVSLFSIIGVLVFIYLVADYSATLMLTSRSKSMYIETIGVIKKFLTANQMLPSIQKRMNDYFTLQWFSNSGYTMMKNKYILFDAPRHLDDKQRVAKYAEAILSVPLFQGLDEELIKMLSAKGQTVFLPPNEFVTYAGEIARNMYIIDMGYVEIISASSGMVEKILGPGSHFCVFDMILVQSSIYNVRSVTHLRLIKLSYVTIKKVFQLCPGLYEELSTLVESTKSSLAVQRLFARRTTDIRQKIIEEENLSWFIFSRNKLHPRCIDYEKAFDDIGFFRFSKTFLLRRTIIPDGNFIMFWEMFRAICAILTGLLYLPLFIFRMKKFLYSLIILDIFGIVDMYIRLHVCYYNKKGILVTHPRYTAYHYLTSGFIIDLIGLLPMGHMVYLFQGSDDDSNTFYMVQNFINFNKLLQLYRVPDAFSWFQKDTLKAQNVFLNISKFILYTLVFFNVLACSLIIITSEFDWYDDEMNITPKLNSWISKKEGSYDFDVDEPRNLYITAYYWVVSTTLSIGFGDLTAQDSSEMYFIIFSIIAGYLLFTYFLVIISSSKASININLTLYQEHMKQLVSYMKKEKISKELRNRAINYFEYIWQRTHGLKGYEILKKCHIALHQDSLMFLYKQTLLKVPIFIELKESFYRTLGTHLQELYFLRNTPIIKLNDIMSTVYIIHKGEAVVIGPDGTHFATLTRGCMFGNIDNILCSRSMTTIVSSKAIDLLCIETEKLYALIKNYPMVINRLQRYILMKNLSYVTRTNTRQEMMQYSKDDLGKDYMEHNEKMGKLQKLTYSGILQLPSMLLAFCSCVVVMYHLAFQNHSYIVLTITYGLDVFHIFKLYTGFHFPYRNNVGEFVTDKKKIRSRYLTFSRFYMELIALLPIDIFALIAPKTKILYALTWLRMNRMLRIWTIIHFFDVTSDRLNINVVTIKLGSILIYFTLILHIGSCILYIIGYSNGICTTANWMCNEEKYLMCKKVYLCSFYFMTTITTTTGYGDFVPKTILEMIVCIIVMVAIKFATAIFIGDISAIVQNYSHSLVNYDHGMKKLKEFLTKNTISEPLIERVVSYTKYLWSNGKGYQLPVFVVNAPSFLMEEIKREAYGSHLLTNFVFVACHTDFLRLLIAKMRVESFFTGDIICQQGDINETMYFIHKGTVDVLSVSDDEEVKVDQLREMDCFGLIQGLFCHTPHMHTFKATAVTEILYLKLREWGHLLKFYPAARFEIYQRIQKI